MNYSAVKTEERAIELIKMEVEASCLSVDDGVILHSTTHCECGETNVVVWKDTLGNCDKLLSVAVCDACGDDDAFISDVLVIE